MIPLSTPIGVEIVCIDDRTRDDDAWVFSAHVRTGHVYTVRNIGLRDFVEGDWLPCVWLSEIVSDAIGESTVDLDVPFGAVRFRLLEKPNELYSLLDGVSRETETV